MSKNIRKINNGESMAKVCIFCEKEPNNICTYPVRDDFIIKTIRTIKQKLGIAKNNELCVCENCLPIYTEKKKKFERNVLLHVAVGVIVFVLLNSLQFMNGRFSVEIFLSSLLFAVLIGGLPILNYRTPLIGEAIEPFQQSQTPIIPATIVKSSKTKQVKISKQKTNIKR